MLRISSSPEAVTVKALDIRVLIQGLMEGRSGGLLSGGGADSVLLHDLANTVVIMGHRRRCPACVEAEQTTLIITEVVRQQCGVSSGWYPTNNLTSASVDLRWQGRDLNRNLDVGGYGRM